MDQPLLDQPAIKPPMPTDAKILKGVSAFTSVFDQLVFYLAIVTTFTHFSYFIVNYIYSPGYLLADDVPLWWSWFVIGGGGLYIIVWMCVHLLMTVSEDDFQTWYGWALIAGIVFVALSLGLTLVFVIRVIYYFYIVMVTVPALDTSVPKFWVLWGFAVAMSVGFIVQIITYLIQSLGNFQYGNVEYANAPLFPTISSSISGVYSSGVKSIRQRIVNKSKPL